MKVFLSHSSRDKPAVEALARHLRQQGIDAWSKPSPIAPIFKSIWRARW